jgi:hypothetical protein
MKSPWFRRTGWFHVPVSIPGWIITLLAVAFLATVIIAADRSVHSTSDFFYAIFPYVIPTFLLVQWVAEQQGKK